MVRSVINEGLTKTPKLRFWWCIGLDLNISNIALLGIIMLVCYPCGKYLHLSVKSKSYSARWNALDVLTTPTITRQTSRGRRRNIVNKKGKAKKGKRKWNNSKTYNKTAASKRKLERRKTVHTTQNRKVVNEKAWQAHKNWECIRVGRNAMARLSLLNLRICSSWIEA